MPLEYSSKSALTRLKEVRNAGLQVGGGVKPDHDHAGAKLLGWAAVPRFSQTSLVRFLA